MTDIPMARAILETALASAYRDDQWRKAAREALGLMTRKVRPGRPTGNVPMTAELGAKARHLRDTTDLSNAQIGRMLKVDGGRVSEALNGRW